MRLQIIPKAKIVYLPTAKTEEEIASCLVRLYVKQKNVKFMTGHHDFMIERTLWNNSHSVIIANGHIEVTQTSTIRLQVVARDSYLFYFASMWYTIIISILLFVILTSIVNKTFNLLSLIVFPLGFLGYGLTTLTLQGAMEELIIEVRQAIK